METPAYFGNFPYPANEKKPCVINDETSFRFIYTEGKPQSSDLNWIYASTQHMTFAKYQLAPGSTFDPVDVHAGDEVYYVLKGTVTMLNPALGQVEDVHAGEVILMPKGAPHKAYNFTNDETIILYVIAPKMWDEEGPPEDYNGAMKLFKYHLNREEKV